MFFLVRHGADDLSCCDRRLLKLRSESVRYELLLEPIPLCRGLVSIVRRAVTAVRLTHFYSTEMILSEEQLDLSPQTKDLRTAPSGLPNLSSSIYNISR